MKWVPPVVLLLIVSVVGYLVVQGLRQNQAKPDPGLAEEAAGPGRAYPGLELQIEDDVFPLTVGCQGPSANDPAYVLTIQNDGLIEADYVVQVTLVDDQQGSVEIRTTVEDLQPNERREQVLASNEDPDRFDDCRITAVQGERRVLLAR